MADLMATINPAQPAAGPPADAQGAETLEVQRWRARIKAAEEEREAHAHIWRLLRNMNAGNNFRKDFQTKDGRQPVNLANNYSRRVLPHLLPRDRDLDFRCNANKPGPEYEQSAKLMSERVTAVMRAIRLKVQARKAIRSSFYSVGILKTGFEVAVGPVAPVKGEDGQPVDVDVNRDRVGGEEYLDAGLPFVQWVPANRFLVEKGATALEAASWCAHKIYRKTAALKADPKFARYAASLQSTHDSVPRELEAEETGGGKSGERDPATGYTCLFEIYDRDAMKVKYIGAAGCGCEQFLTEPQPWPEGIEGHPFDLIYFDDCEGYFWPNPPLAVVLDLGSGVDVLYSTLMEAAKKAKKLVLYDPTQITETEVAPIAKAQDADIVPVKGLGQNVKVVDFGGVTPDQMQVMQIAMDLHEKMSGVGDFMRGVGPSSPSTTATEVASAQQASGIFMDDMKGAVDAAFSSVAAKVGALLIIHADMLADITLPVGDPKEARFVGLGPGVIGEYLDYAYEYVPTAVEKVDPAIVQKRTETLIGQSMDPNLAAKLQQEGMMFRTAPLLKRQLELMGEKNADDYLVALPPPNTEAEKQAAQQEDQIMVRTGEILPVSPGNDHAAHYEQHLADYQASGSQAIAQHAMMHEQFMQAAEGGPQATGNGAAGQGVGEGAGGGLQQAAGLAAAAADVG